MHLFQYINKVQRICMTLCVCFTTNHLHLISLVNFTLVHLVWTQGTSPQLYACMGGRAKRKRPNLWPYGWNPLVIGLEIKQARAFNN